MHFLELIGAFIAAKLLYPIVVFIIAIVIAVVRGLFDAAVEASHKRRIVAAEQRRLEYMRKQQFEEKVINSLKQKELERR